MRCFLLGVVVTVLGFFIRNRPNGHGIQLTWILGVKNIISEPVLEDFLALQGKLLIFSSHVFCFCAGDWLELLRCGSGTALPLHPDSRIYIWLRAKIFSIVGPELACIL